MPDDVALACIQKHLLAWFAAHGRSLPWRQTRNPYHILVSEMMLQQTQVDRVVPRYAAFLEAFPTLEHLAAASTGEVIRQWAGLGYNRRAVNLQTIARIIHDAHSGTFPQQVDDLRQLPGIGPYTAGAIACFAFGQDVAFMDTNIRRVLRRLLVGPEDAPPPVRDYALLQLAQAAIPPGQGWAWNQGLMELGALICTSTTPACWHCPLREHCRTWAAWLQTDEMLCVPPDQPDAPGATSGPAYPLAATPTRRKRRVVERPAQPFVGSNRYYRGRLVDRLRILPAGERLPLDQLGPLIKDDFDAAQDGSWLQALADSVVRDGLAEMHGDEIGLPET
jgi:A/G-specific adenine glycosylase